jgi:hypothetical protein
MKRMNLAVLGLAAAALLALPATTRAGIVGSPHDFSGETWNIVPSDPNSTCGVCHQPHKADSSKVPLWIHTTTASAFTMYNTNTVAASKLNATPDATPGGVSLACLSCHDGTVAVNSYAGGVKGGSSIFVTNNANLGTDLTHTHPISFTYDSALATADGFLKDPAQTVLQPDSGTFNVGSDTSIKGVLLNGGNRLECSACHDVHNQMGTPFDITTNPKLVKIVGTESGKGSLLCRSCHIK